MPGMSGQKWRQGDSTFGGGGTGAATSVTSIPGPRTVRFDQAPPCFLAGDPRARGQGCGSWLPGLALPSLAT